MVSLMVNKGYLTDWGQFLIDKAQELNSALDGINTNMGSVADSWKDENGSLIVENYASFVADAKNINSDLISLGSKAKSFSSKYTAIEKKYAAKMR